MRSFKLLTFFILSSVASHLCHAGVITSNGNNEPTRWVTDSGLTFNIYKGSYEAVTAANPSDTFLLNDTRLSSQDERIDLFLEYRDDLQAREAFDPIDATIVTFFAVQQLEQNTLEAYFVHYGDDGWELGHYPNNGPAIQSNATELQGLPLVWAALQASPSNVPEPSTAIAMGLLGIVGFAGNRRPRRQS